MVSCFTAGLLVRAQKSCPINWKNARMVTMERTSFKVDLSVKLFVIPKTSMGMMIRNSNDSLKELVCVYARILPPGDYYGNGFFRRNGYCINRAIHPA